MHLFNCLWIAAIHLYSKFGFKIISEVEDYAGPNRPKLKVLKMVRM